MWLTVLNKLTLIHDDDLVEVEYRVKLVRNSYEGVGREFWAQKALDVGVCCCIKTGDVSVYGCREKGRNDGDLLAGSFIQDDDKSFFPS